MSYQAQWNIIAFCALFLINLQAHLSPSYSQDASWSTINADGSPTERHENGFVAYNGKLYMLGGRNLKRVQVYDPNTNRWSDGAFPPFQMHHFQAVVFNDLIYVIGAYTGTCCSDENGVSHVWTYNPQTDSWAQSHEIPADRRRGSAGAVVYNGKIYIAGGIEGGHGLPATAYNWFDEYDPVTGQWKVLPNAPRVRDHYHAVVKNGKMYLVGGRDTSDGSILSKTISEIDVYDFNTGNWSTLSSTIPTPRGGTASILYRGEILVIGGESGNQELAYATNEAFNPDSQTWRTLSSLNVGRHGTQATLLNDAVYIAAGAAQVGGVPELDSIERYQDSSEELLTRIQTLKPAWNLISLPVDPVDDFYANIYDDVSLAPGFLPQTWDGFNYVSTSNLSAGNGFWLKLEDNPSNLTQTISGTFVNDVQFSLLSGWNMISGPSCDNVPLLQSSTSPQNAIQEGLSYFYDIGGYKPAYSFSNPRGLVNQGRGYWVFATMNATLTLSCNANKYAGAAEVSTLHGMTDSFGSITVRDTNAGFQTLFFGSTLRNEEQLTSFRLPPKGPSGEFDVRFSDGMRLTEDTEAYIRLESSSYPLSVIIDRLPENNTGYVLLEELDESTTTIRSHRVSAADQVLIHTPETAAIKIHYSEDIDHSLPGTFTLHGNYPNPFNPTTRITFDIPEAGDLTLRVVDVQGRVVLTETHNNVTAAYNQSLSVDATALPAGTYIYSVTLQTETDILSQSGSMVLLK